jgi:hypothetical protein
MAIDPLLAKFSAMISRCLRTFMRGGLTPISIECGNAQAEL